MLIDPRAAARLGIEKRRARASLKAVIGSGSVDPSRVLTEALQDAESVAATLRVSEFLGSIGGVGAVKTEKIMTELSISPTKRLGGLGARQRAALENWLNEQRIKK